MYSSQSLISYPKCQAHIFLYAITGCDPVFLQHLMLLIDIYIVTGIKSKQNDPEDYEWILNKNSLKTIQTLLPPVPEKLLCTIFFNYAKGCHYNWGCKKEGLFC